MVTHASEAHFPADTVKLVGGMAVDMLPLLHVDTSDLVSLELHIPGGAPHSGSLTSILAEVLSLV